MQMSEEDAMNQMNQLTQSPEVQMIEQLVGVVQQLMAQGVSEEEIKMFLKEQGLDDEDIESLFEMIADSGMQQEQGGDIDQQLQSMM
jgi:exoribonuclease R